MPTDPNKIFPPLPEGLSLPFYYASVNAIWMYYKVSPEKVAPYLQDIALEPALFDGQALVLLNFQRYTGFISSLLSAVNTNSADLALSAMSPIMQYTRDPKGRVFAYEWNVFGVFESALLDCGPTLVIGQSSHAMRAAMYGLLDGVPAVGMQTFETRPVATSTRGYLVQPET